MEHIENVELVHFPEVDEIDFALLAKSIEHFFKKIGATQEDQLKLTYKGYARGGIKKQHEIKAQLALGGKIFSASDTEWQLLKVIQEVLKKLEKEVLRKHF